MDGTPVLVCHRGASALAPENTLESFRIAMEAGVDYSELDVHLSHTGDLIVTHDALEEPDAQRRVPRLTDVFALVRGRMGLYVELKGDDTGLALGDLVRLGAASDVPLISGSFRLELVSQLLQAAPHVSRSILFGEAWSDRVEAMVGTCRELQVRYAHPCFRPIDRALVQQFQQAGLLVMTPHTNDPAEAKYFAAIGVNVVASDDPRVVLPLRAC